MPTRLRSTIGLTLMPRRIPGTDHSITHGRCRHPSYATPPTAPTHGWPCWEPQGLQAPGPADSLIDSRSTDRPNTETAAFSSLGEPGGDCRAGRSPTKRRSPTRPDRTCSASPIFVKGEAAPIDAQASSASDAGTSAAKATRMKASRLTTPMACAHGASARLSSPMPMISSAAASRAPSVGPRSSSATPL